ncbi:MAG: hypothetical protein KatS3mg077_3204 [Candidatus Binatia bacterium]|nr:MAG: hypothetical protein KatS3mg077_3204 [Candidatus Binatia bacterium]
MDGLGRGAGPGQLGVAGRFVALARTTRIRVASPARPFGLRAIRDSPLAARHCRSPLPGLQPAVCLEVVGAGLVPARGFVPALLPAHRAGAIDTAAGNPNGCFDHGTPSGAVFKGIRRRVRPRSRTTQRSRRARSGRW